MKKIGILLLLIITLLFSALPVSAAELSVQNGSADVNLTVTVPETHKVNINAPSDVEISFNGLSGDVLDLSRLKNVVLDVKVKSGYRVTKIMLGSIDVTKFYSNGKLTLSGINMDGLELKVESEKIPTDNPPQTGDNSNIWLWLVVLFISGLGVFGGIFATKKRKVTK